MRTWNGPSRPTPRIIGVNARDLETLEVDVPSALARLGRIGADRVAVMESGIARPADALAAVEGGASAILVGEALMRAADPGAMVNALTTPAGDRSEEQLDEEKESMP